MPSWHEVLTRYEVLSTSDGTEALNEIDTKVVSGNEDGGKHEEVEISWINKSESYQSSGVLSISQDHSD